jgi:DNA-binding Xre family transcriptional regulator
MAILNRVPELVAAKFGGKENINIQHVAAAVGLTYVSTAKWLKNRIDRADFPVLEKWCRYLECQPGDILIYTKEDSG